MIMQVPAWQIASWNNVSVPLAEWNESIGLLCHLGTSSHIDEKESGLRYGQAVWGICARGDKWVGIAWDWREIRRGVVAMSDPMTVLSNLVFLDEAGRPVDSFKRVLHLNNAVFSLNWQAMACANSDQMAEPVSA
jgi:hypothetical protein